MFTVEGTATAGTPEVGGVEGVSSGTDGGVTGGMMPPWYPGVMGGSPGVVGAKPPAGIWTGTQTEGNAGTMACPPISDGREAGRPAPQRPQKVLISGTA